ncbi:MAG: response regulator, partial [Acidobacteria bacterium]|nr:response regulator [Acidobacteriota bacterium]
MSRRLLIVDDEESMLEFLSLLFQDSGFTVSTASSAAEARERLESTFDLVLCDIMMPDGNGLDLLREIKDSRPATSVIMMTAYSSSKSAIEAMRHGAYDY